MPKGYGYDKPPKSPITKKSSAFKMKGFSGFKGSPLAQNTKPEGYYTVKDASNTLTETGQGDDVTAEYKKTGSKSTRDHIAAGGTITKHPVSGKITMQASQAKLPTQQTTATKQGS